MGEYIHIYIYIYIPTVCIQLCCIYSVKTPIMYLGNINLICILEYRSDIRLTVKYKLVNYPQIGT